MSDFSCFLKANAVNSDNFKYVASKRFIDPKTKKPVEWELKAIDGATDELLRKECTKRVPVKGKRGQFIPEMDTDEYLAKLCAYCTVYPPLNSAELQDDYGVKSGDALLKMMLTAGELIELKAFVSEINGFDIGMDEMVDEAKN